VRWIGRLVGLLVVALGAIVAVFVVGMRTKSPLVQDNVRRYNRAVTNPRVLRSAGSPGASASVIHHVGRTSGRSRATPVGPFAVGDGFVIALPYGPGTDWVRNVLASGSATLVHEGSTIPIDRPEVVPVTQVIEDLPASQQRVLRLFGVEECLRVQRAG
jgi:deazaflavin-dependent oxidoreductase (nitroreductase family)